MKLISWFAVVIIFNLPVYASPLLPCSDSIVYTRNWTDSAVMYGFALRPGGSVEVKRGDAPWTPMIVPSSIIRIRKIAADNNRLLVLTADNNVWWYTMVDDVASWAEKVQLGTSVVDKKSAEHALPWFQKLWNDFLVLFGFKPLPAADAAQNSQQAKRYVNILEAYTVGVTTDQYKQWTAECHRGGTWVNLFEWREVKRKNIDRSKIVDIAIGHWPRTVSTVYFLLNDGSVYWLDEELIMPSWKKIEKKTDRWPSTSDYYMLRNQPQALPATSKIRACNSVVCVSLPTATGTDFYWIRWDYHQKGDFIYWPLDWCEDGWHHVSSPCKDVVEFRFDTHGDADPCTGSSVWHVPDATWGNSSGIPLVDGHYEGFLGNVNREDVSRYQVVLTVKTALNRYERYTAFGAVGDAGIWVGIDSGGAVIP